jgi:hypothetical protein
MFWAFQLSFDVNILSFWSLFPKNGQNFITFSGHNTPGGAMSSMLDPFEG